MSDNYLEAQKWWDVGVAEVQQARKNSKNFATQKSPAKNVIIFLGDGMGISTV